MEKQFECTTSILGPGPEDENQVKILNRILSWNNSEDGESTSYEADPRHVEITLELLQLIQLESVTFIETIKYLS